ncbi:hypothetical protein ACMCNP_06910 [Candidatus Acidulodesulfobacterium sp. H_13]
MSGILSSLLQKLLNVTTSSPKTDKSYFTVLYCPSLMNRKYDGKTSLDVR